MFEKSLGLYQACWRRENTDRPLMGLNIGMFANDWFPTLMESIPNGLVQPEDIRTDLFLKDLECLYHTHQSVEADYPFVAAPLVYLPWMEAIMGCPVMASPETMWSEPCIEAWEDWDGQRP